MVVKGAQPVLVRELEAQVAGARYSECYVTELIEQAAEEIKRLRRIAYSPLSEHDERCDCARCVPF